MLLRIENTPRPYAWGSRTAIAELLGTAPSGEPEAELDAVPEKKIHEVDRLLPRFVMQRIVKNITGAENKKWAMGSGGAPRPTEVRAGPLV